MRSDNRRSAGLVAILIISLASAGFLVYAAPLPDSVIKEEGFYYGTGSGETLAAAMSAAKQDLVYSALVDARDRAGIRGPIDMSPEIADTFKIPGMKIIAQSKKGVTPVTLVYRAKKQDWDKYQAQRADKARTDILPRLQAVEVSSGRPTADRVLEAASMWNRLRKEALAYLLTTDKAPDSPLVSTTLEKLCAEQTVGLKLTMDIQRGFTGKDSVFSGRCSDASGAAAGALPLRIEWSVRGLDTPQVETISSKADGSFVLKFPQNPAFHNRSVSLRIATNLASAAPMEALQKADERITSRYAYQYFDDVTAYFSRQAFIAGGSYTIGSMPGDRKAARKEAPRQVSVASYRIDNYLVTNALYAMFLDDSQATDYPKFWDNPDYNQDNQPVTGVSYADAVRFAQWLSTQLGQTWRLPTEAEWEIAARAGKESIYPWGDESPVEGERANYNGNSRFSGPSPVGSFDTGKNNAGMFDMAGNVWQWTSTPRDPEKAAGGGAMIIKGGSWMDGPAELRVSNRPDRNPNDGYPDVGIRLVREAAE